jgi:hypothetical protein
MINKVCLGFFNGCLVTNLLDDEEYPGTKTIPFRR